MPTIEPEDFPNYPYPRRRVTLRRDNSLLLVPLGIALYLLTCGGLYVLYLLFGGK